MLAWINIVREPIDHQSKMLLKSIFIIELKMRIAVALIWSLSPMILSIFLLETTIHGLYHDFAVVDLTEQYSLSVQLFEAALGPLLLWLNSCGMSV